MSQGCSGCFTPLGPGDAFCGNCGQPAPSREARIEESVPSREHPRVGSPGDGTGPTSRVNGGGSEGGPTSPEAAPKDGDQAESARYAEVSDVTYDPLANSRFLGQVGRQVLLYFFFYLMAEFAVSILCLLVTVAAGFSAASSLWVILSVAIWFAMGFMFWFTPIPALLGQHSRLLRGCAGLAGTMLGDIRQMIVQHQTPCDTLGNRPMSPPGEGHRTYIELRRGNFCGMVSCFPHGRDLYVGWTFWIYISPFRLMLMFVGRKIQNYTGRGNDMYQTLRYDSTRATVAAIHSSVVEVAEKASPGVGPAPIKPDEGPGGLPTHVRAPSPLA